jgi:hypothetical protein
MAKDVLHRLGIFLVLVEQPADHVVTNVVESEAGSAWDQNADGQCCWPQVIRHKNGSRERRLTTAFQRGGEKVAILRIGCLPAPMPEAYAKAPGRANSSRATRQ